MEESRSPSNRIVRTVSHGGSCVWVQGRSGALFVIYRQGDRWAVDRTDPMSHQAELWLAGANLHGAADLIGSGSLQIVWSRRWVIATGPLPYSVFVTEWHPGSFRNIPGDMMISRYGEVETVAIDGRDLVLSGHSRAEWLAWVRTDRYRYDGEAFRLVDRLAYPGTVPTGRRADAVWADGRMG